MVRPRHREPIAIREQRQHRPRWSVQIAPAQVRRDYQPDRAVRQLHHRADRVER